jgi:hypothetical protein
MKILAFITPAVLALAAGVVLFFMLLIGLNGYSEQQATPGLMLFVVWVLLGAVVAGALSFFAANYLTTVKSWRPWTAALLASVVLTAAGVGFGVAGVFAAILTIEALR